MSAIGSEADAPILAAFGTAHIAHGISKIIMTRSLQPAEVGCTALQSTAVSIGIVMHIRRHRSFALPQ
jgi:hypothetical protein